ncbi:chaplin [Streptomyces apocyni]|uniref:chaplin n=1 Tax=Streptomyces apocyni TaxID=2654677 RepID=UPI0012EA78C8|nr:chaplin [Streptomyces apocyni]
MRQVTRKGLITVAAASGVLAVTGGYAHADSGANGSASDSPGVLSGNTVQAPVYAPVNVCGNTVSVIGLLNPTAGNSCVNSSDGSGKSGTADGSNGSSKGGSKGSGSPDGSQGGDAGQPAPSGGGAQADGSAKGSPGVLSGNVIQAPVHAPVNACGNSVNVGGLGNGTTGNDCANGSGEAPPAEGNPDPESPTKPATPEKPTKPSNPEEAEGEADKPQDGPGTQASGTQIVTPPKGSGHLAQTGNDLPVGIAAGAGAGLLLAGTVLYRKTRRAA